MKINEKQTQNPQQRRLTANLKNTPRQHPENKPPQPA
jgi:hypothetical protein